MSWSFEFRTRDKPGAREGIAKRQTKSPGDNLMPERIGAALNALVDAMPDNPEGVIRVKSHGHTDAKYGTANCEVAFEHFDIA